MHKAPARSALLAAVYGGVVLLLLGLALFARGFAANVGDARAVGRYSFFPPFQARNLRDLTLSWNGIALRFSDSSRPALKGIETTDDGTDLVFDTEMRLRLSPGSDIGGSLSITRIASTTAASPLVVPFSVSGVLEQPSTSGTLAWRRAGRTFLLEIPAGATIDDAAGTLTLPSGPSAWTARLRPEGMAAAAAAVASAVRVSPARSTPAAARLPEEEAMPTDEQLRAAMSRFADAAFAGWSASRLSAAVGQWKMPDGSTVFSEDIGTALLAEAIARGSLQQYLPIWSNAMARQQKRSPAAQLSFATSVYVGGVRDFARSQQSRAAGLIDNVQALLAKPDDSLLSIPALIPLLLDHGSAELLKAAGAFLQAHGTTRLDTALAVGLLEGLVDYDQLVDAGDAVNGALKETVNKGIMPRILTSESGIYLDSGSGIVDIGNSIRCGALLMRAGEIMQSTFASAVGRGLVASALSLADDAGMLPRTLTLASSAHDAGRAGALPPESVYALLPLGRYLPREIPAPQLGQGAWIWTAARVQSARRTEAQITLVLGYPRGVAHHLVLQGVRPFAQVRLHGIPWRTDPTYFKYSDGWAYDASSRTLYVKLTGKSEREELDILY